MQPFRILAAGALLIRPIRGAVYSPVREYAGSTFFDGWNYFGNWDNLTLGDTIYLDRPTALAQNLTFINGAGNAILRVDNFTNVAAGEKRNSVRLESKDFYDAGSLWIIDALHIPYGCSTWPAFWAKGDDWPAGGEIDIIEGINMMDRNQVALHTTPGCTKRDAPHIQLGQTLGEDCSTDSGCVIAEQKQNSYGQAFAQNGGGVFATQFDASGIKIWYWPRAAIPQSISPSSSKPLSDDFADWGLPTASYTAGTCNISKFFTPQRLVLNIALCGVWAGPAFAYQGTCGNSGGAATCSDYVAGPGSPKYDDAYFEIQYVRAYSTAAPIPTSTTSTAASTPTDNSSVDAPSVKPEPAKSAAMTIPMTIHAFAFTPLLILIACFDLVFGCLDGF